MFFQQTKLLPNGCMHDGMLFVYVHFCFNFIGSGTLASGKNQKVWKPVAGKAGKGLQQ